MTLKRGKKTLKIIDINIQKIMDKYNLKYFNNKKLIPEKIKTEKSNESKLVPGI